MSGPRALEGFLLSGVCRIAVRSYKVLVGALGALQVFQFFMVPYGV